MITVGSIVKKKSGKPFQNKQKEAVVTELSTMVVPVSKSKNSVDTETKVIDCVYLEGCIGPVSTKILEGVFDVQE